jgi:acid phosphatase
MLEGVAKGTRLMHDENSLAGANHAAGGRGVFGQLSQLGLLQMVDLGNRLREELHLYDEDNDTGDENHLEDEHGNKHIYGGKLFHGKAPLHPQRIKVTSTNFPRTVQSVQGLLVGLFPDGTDDHDVEIDVTRTNGMIPSLEELRNRWNWNGNWLQDHI